MPSRAKNAREQAKSCYADGALSSVCLKTKLCSFYSKGGCPRDRFCKFAHGEEELQAAPDLTHTKMCPSLMRSGVCKMGAACRFAHKEEELRPVAEILPQPALASALLAVWEQKYERWSDLSSTDASDGTESVVSSLSSLGRESLGTSDNFGEVPETSFSQPSLPTTPPSEVRVVDESFLDVLGHMNEGSQFWHAATGLPLTIRKTFFDIDDRSVHPGAARRCLSADARIGASRSFV